MFILNNYDDFRFKKKIHMDMQTWNLFEEGRLAEVVDPALKEYPQDQVIRYIKVALFCTQAVAGRRPSMLQVVDMLSKPVQLNDEEISSPGYMEDRGKISRGLRVTNTTYPRSKDSTSSDTTTPFTSGHVTFTEMHPRWALLKQWVSQILFAHTNRLSPWMWFF